MVMPGAETDGSANAVAQEEEDLREEEADVDLEDCKRMDAKE